MDVFILIGQWYDTTFRYTLGPQAATWDNDDGIEDRGRILREFRFSLNDETSEADFLNYCRRLPVINEFKGSGDIKYSSVTFDRINDCLVESRYDCWNSV